MIDLLKDYLEKRIQLVKYELIGVFANVASSLASSLLLLVLGLIILCMFSFAGAYWLGQLLDNTALGFAAMGLFYLLIFVIYLFVSKEKMELKIKDQIVQSALSSENKEVVKIVNLLGQEVEYTPNTVLIYQYSDGTSEKVFTIEK